MQWLRSRFAILAATGLAAVGSMAGGLFLTIAPAAHAQDVGATVTVGTPTDRFTPNIVTINVGQSVTFNWSAGFHNVDLEDVTPDIAMDSTHTTGTTQAFTTPGTFYYYCSIHADESEATEAHVQANDAMVGKIVVLAATTSTPQPTTVTTTPTTTTTTPTAQPTTATATASPSQTATGTPSAGVTATPNQACILKVSDQTVAPGSMVVTVDEEQQVDAGYMAIHESSASGGPGPVIGTSPYMPAGTHMHGQKVTVDRPLKNGETVWAMLHTENNGNQTYDGASVDLPTVSTHCGNPATGNIATFPIKISFATAGSGTGSTSAPSAPNTGSGVQSGSTNYTFYAILASLAAAILAGSGGILAYRRRQG